MQSSPLSQSHNLLVGGSSSAGIGLTCSCVTYARGRLSSCSIHITKIIIKWFLQFSGVLGIPLGRRFRVLVHLLELVNQNHSLNIIQSDGIIFTGLGNVLRLMLNQICAQLEVLLSLLRHIMTLIVIVTAWSSDNLAEGGNLLILQKHNLILAIDSLLVYNSLSCILHEANANESLPHSSIIGHGHMIIKHVQSVQSVQFFEYFQQNSCTLAISVLAMSMCKPPNGVWQCYITNLPL